MVGYSQIATFDAPNDGEYHIAGLYADDVPEDCRVVEVWDEETFLIEQESDDEGAWVRTARISNDGDKAINVDTLANTVTKQDDRRIVYDMSSKEWLIEEQIQ